MFTFSKDFASDVLTKELPLILGYIDIYKTKRRCCHIVLGNQSEGIIIEKSINTDDKDWKEDFIKVARSKFEMTKRTGMSSREVVYLHPELLQRGDTRHPGSMIRNGCIAACSGFEWWHDESISDRLITAALTKGTIIGEEVKENAVLNDSHFLL